jgi:hypothetical protein
VGMDRAWKTAFSGHYRGVGCTATSKYSKRMVLQSPAKFQLTTDGPGVPGGVREGPPRGLFKENEDGV